MGPRNLYTVRVTWAPAAVAAPAVSESRRVGFRALYLVTADDSNPASLLDSEGSGNFTMRWRVNGASMYSFGGCVAAVGGVGVGREGLPPGCRIASPPRAPSPFPLCRNVIPVEEMEGRITDATYVQFVRSAAAAGFNTFRVWGGGIYPPQSFYDAADEAGILIYHDAMYSSDGRIPPAQTALEDAELRHNIRRVASHPSIGHWDSCNGARQGSGAELEAECGAVPAASRL